MVDPSAEIPAILPSRLDPNDPVPGLPQPHKRVKIVDLFAMLFPTSPAVASGHAQICQPCGGPSRAGAAATGFGVLVSYRARKILPQSGPFSVSRAD